MEHHLAVFDSFSPNAFRIREEVIDGGFTTEIGPDGKEYTGVSLKQYPELFELLSQAVGHNVIPRLSCFRLNLKGEMPHSYIHSDDICASHAAVLYLNTPSQCKGGTAFWRHKGMCLDRMPREEELRGGGYDPKWFCDMMLREWNELKQWEKRDAISMKFNRLVTYPTSIFHSRFPFEGFGTTPEDGRLVWTCFYDMTDEPANSEGGADE